MDILLCEYVSCFVISHGCLKTKCLFYSFVDRDMFMLHRGGGVGHQVAKWVDIEEENGDIEGWEADVDQEDKDEDRSEDEEEDQDEGDQDETEEEEENQDEEKDIGDDVEDEILAYGYDHEDYENEESDEEGFIEEGENEGIEENEERRGNLGPEDGEFEDEHDGYFGYAAL